MTVRAAVLRCLGYSHSAAASDLGQAARSRMPNRRVRDFGRRLPQGAVPVAVGRLHNVLSLATGSGVLVGAIRDRCLG